MSETTDTSATLVAHQMELERLFSKNQLIPRIKAEFQNSNINFVDHMIENQIPIPFGLDVLTQMALHRRCTLPTLVGILLHHFDDAQLTADTLLKCAELDLVDWSSNLGVFIVKWTISADVQEDLDRFQFPLPMVVEPKPIRTNRDTGYLLGSGSVILKNNHHEDDVCLDHLNHVNSYKFAINHGVVKFIKNKWKNLDKPKSGETREDYQKRKRAFEKYDRTAKDVISVLTQHSETFHLTHRYDKRGRVYSMGYHVNYQGNPWNKACIEFADKELVE